MRADLRPALVVLLFVAVAAVAVASLSTAGARRDGVSGRSQGGCTCHGNGSPWNGVGGQLPVVPLLDGFPDAYEPYATYDIAIAAEGGAPYLKAGFDLNVTAGNLSIPEGEANAQITTPDTFGGVGGEATHKSPGTRAWRVRWTAPREGTGPVEVHLAVNSVNGNDMPDALDQWNKVALAIEEANVAPRPATRLFAEPLGPAEARVSWLASPDADIAGVRLHGSPQTGFDAGGPTLLAELNATQDAATVGGLRPGATYEFVVVVTDAGGLSAESERATLILPASPPPAANATTRPSGQESHDAPGPALPTMAAALAAVAALAAAALGGGRRAR